MANDWGIATPDCAHVSPVDGRRCVMARGHGGYHYAACEVWPDRDDTPATVCKVEGCLRLRHHDGPHDAGPDGLIYD